MMIDIYVAAKSRSKSYVDAFHKQWIVDFSPMATELEFPHGSSQPQQIFYNVDELIIHLLKHPTEWYQLYWSNPDRDAKTKIGMLFFTQDNGLIVGISTYEEDHRVIAECLLRMGQTVDGKWGGVWGDSPPPETTIEFVNTLEHMPLNYYPTLTKGDIQLGLC